MVATLAVAAYLAHFNPALDPTNATGVASLAARGRRTDS